MQPYFVIGREDYGAVRCFRTRQRQERGAASSVAKPRSEHPSATTSGKMSSRHATWRCYRKQR